jgi:aspartyl-tRNA(Asn)/glutamyl-tRNA(Gln) amidotransferase subunit B
VYLEICDGNMEEGSFRCDANVSIRPMGQKEFGTRAELKNMNSFRNVQRALEYEIKRQQYLLESGGKVVQETRLWDDAQGASISMRSKEEAHDYRYFPDPDLVPILVDDAWVERIRKELPELPLAKRERFLKDYQIPAYDAGVLTADKALAQYYEDVVKLCDKPKQASNWVMGDVLRFLNEDKLDIRQCPITAKDLADMIKLIEAGTISGKMAKDIITDMYKTGKPPQKIIEEKGLVQITDEGELAKTITAIIEANPAQLADYRGGKEKLFGFFVGQVMKATQGKANPQLVNDMLKKMLAG